MIHNVKIDAKAVGKTMDSIELKKAITEAESLLGKKGRLNVRPSGTEPLIRIMVEHSDEKIISQITRNIESAIKNSL